MRKISVILLMLIGLSCFAQETTFVGREHTDILTLHFSGLWQNDEYLSPLLYKGFCGGLRNEWWQTFRRDTAWLHEGVVAGDFGRTLSPRKNNAQLNLNLQTGWGAYYDFGQMIRLAGLNLYLGPMLYADATIRYHYSNVNKPVSVDMSIMLRAKAGISYSMSAKRSSYRLSYSVSTDLLGVMFAPDYWQAYYEMTYSMQHNILFGSFHNRQAFEQELMLDMQYKHSCWRIGLRHLYAQYKTNNLFFSREQVSVVVGTMFNYQTHIKRFR